MKLSLRQKVWFHFGSTLGRLIMVQNVQIDFPQYGSRDCLENHNWIGSYLQFCMSAHLYETGISCANKNFLKDKYMCM